MNYMDTFYYKYDVARNLLNTLPMEHLINQLDSVYYNNQTNPNLKWFMLSAHDTNLLIHMSFLNLSNSDCQFEKYFNGSTTALNCNNYTEFASNLILEMIQDDNSGDYYVKLRYNGVYQYMCDNNQLNCSYLEFRQRVLNPLYPDDQYKQLCGLTSSSSQYSSLSAKNVVSLSEKMKVK